MKRLILVFLSALFCFSVFSQSDSEPVQFLIPGIVCIGDTAEIKYVFRSSSELFSSESSDLGGSYIELSSDASVFTALQDKCSVMKAALEKRGSEYTLSLTFVPWQTGWIDFPEFDLASLIRLSSSGGKASSFVVDLKPVMIESIVEKTHADTFCPPAAPLVVPGTTAFLVVLTAALVLVVSALIFLLVKFSSIALFLRNSGSGRYASRIYRIAKKQLKKLLKNSSGYNDAEFCCELQKIMRDYLEKRFSPSFQVISASSMHSEFERISGGELLDWQAESAEHIIQIFSRCDYIRFARGSVDSKRLPESLYAAVLSGQERESLVDNAEKALFSVSSDSPVMEKQ